MVGESEEGVPHHGDGGVGHKGNGNADGVEAMGRVALTFCIIPLVLPGSHPTVALSLCVSHAPQE